MNGDTLRQNIAIYFFIPDPYFKYISSRVEDDCSYDIYRCILCGEEFRCYTMMNFYLSGYDWIKNRQDHLLKHLFEKEINEIKNILDSKIESKNNIKESD